MQEKRNYEDFLIHKVRTNFFLNVKMETNKKLIVQTNMQTIQTIKCRN